MRIRGVMACALVAGLATDAAIAQLEELAGRLRDLPDLAAAPAGLRDAAVDLLGSSLEAHALLAPLQQQRPGAEGDSADPAGEAAPDDTLGEPADPALDAALAKLDAREADALQADDLELARRLAALRATQIELLELLRPRSREPAAEVAAALERHFAREAEPLPAPASDDAELVAALEQAAGGLTRGPGADLALGQLRGLVRRRSLARRDARAADAATLFRRPPEGESAVRLHARWVDLSDRLRWEALRRAERLVARTPQLDRRNRLLAPLLGHSPLAPRVAAQRDALDRIALLEIEREAGQASTLARRLAEFERLERVLGPAAVRRAAGSGPLASALRQAVEALGAERTEPDADASKPADLWGEIDGLVDELAVARSELWSQLADAVPAAQRAQSDALTQALAQATHERARLAARDAETDPVLPGFSDLPWAARFALGPWMHAALDELGAQQWIRRNLELATDPTALPSQRGQALLSLIEPLELSWKLSIERGAVELEIGVGQRGFAMRDLAELGALPLPTATPPARQEIDAIASSLRSSIRATRAAGPLLTGAPRPSSSGRPAC
jgi:hypothetical protein